MDLSSLKNKGFFPLVADDHVSPAQRTFIVLGLPRGGTTMLAKAFEAMGIFIGDEADNAVGEDTALAAAIESHDKKGAQRIVDQYNAAHDVWAFKRPNIAAHLDASGVAFRNVHYVVVMRDLLSIANRNRLSTFKDPIKDLRESIEASQKLVEYVDRNRDAPMFMLSYDRVLADPREFVQQFSEFCGVPLTTKGVRSVLLAITPDDDYLDSSRSDTFMGRVTDADAQTVSGFFRYHQSDEVPPLELFVNDEPVEASLEWFDMTIERKNGRTFTGRNGFVLTLAEGRSLRHGDKVSVIADDRRRQRLRNCPYRVKIRS